MATKTVQEVKKLPRSLKGFPPPVYLQLPSVGLNISDHSVKLMELVPMKSRFMPGDFDTVSLPDGAVESGEIMDVVALAKRLKQLKDTYKFDYARLSIPEEKAYIFELDIPPTNDSQLYSVLEFHISDHVPLTVDEIVFDYDILERDKRGRVFKVNVSVLPRPVVETFLSVCGEAEIVPLSLEIEAQTTARAVIPFGDKLTHLIIDVGRSRTGLFIAEKGIVKYTATIELGGDGVVKAISEERKMSFEDAEVFKQEHGVERSKYSDSEYQLIDELLNRLTGEVERRRSYWRSRPGKSNEVDSIILVGGNASTPHLDSYLAEQTGLPVSMGNVWVNAFSVDEHNPPLDLNHSLGYASAIGLALSDEI